MSSPEFSCFAKFAFRNHFLGSTSKFKHFIVFKQLFANTKLLVYNKNNELQSNSQAKSEIGTFGQTLPSENQVRFEGFSRLLVDFLLDQFFGRFFQLLVIRTAFNLLILKHLAIKVGFVPLFPNSATAHS